MRTYWLKILVSAFRGSYQSNLCVLLCVCLHSHDWLCLTVCEGVFVLIVSYQGHRAVLPRAQTITEPCITSQLWTLGRERAVARVCERGEDKNRNIHLIGQFFHHWSFFRLHWVWKANMNQMFYYHINISYLIYVIYIYILTSIHYFQVNYEVQVKV